MTGPIKPTLTAFWGDTKKVLTADERAHALSEARLESMTHDEILLRDDHSKRLIVITAVGMADIYCDVCDHDSGVRHSFGRACPRFAECVAGHPLDPNGGVRRKTEERKQREFDQDSMQPKKG